MRLRVFRLMIMLIVPQVSRSCRFHSSVQSWTTQSFCFLNDWKLTRQSRTSHCRSACINSQFSIQWNLCTLATCDLLFRIWEMTKEKWKKKRPYSFHTSCIRRLFLSPHSLSVTTVTLGSRLFFILLQINLLTYSSCLPGTTTRLFPSVSTTRDFAPAGSSILIHW
jgi:hypothetical protein